MGKKLVVLDMDNLFWRSFFKMKDLSVMGFKTGGMFGVIRDIKAYVREYPNHTVVCVWDGRYGSKRRKEMMEKGKNDGILEEDQGYKQNREGRETDEAFIQGLEQKRRVYGAVKKTAVCCIKRKEWEADDVIATIAKLNRDGETIVVSTDEDFYQLLQFGTLIMNPKTKEIMNEERFVKRYGVASKRWIQIRALAGDNSDNIPGVPDVGMGTATKLIAEHGSLKRMRTALKNKDKRGKREDAILDSRKLIRLCLKVSKFFYDFPIELRKLKQGGKSDMDGFIKFLKRYKMGTLAADTERLF